LQLKIKTKKRRKRGKNDFAFDCTNENNGRECYRWCY